MHFSPVNPKKPNHRGAAIDGFGLVLPSVRKIVFEMNCVAAPAEPALAYYRMSEFPETEFTWQPKLRPNGFAAAISAKNEPSNNLYLTLRLYVLFGPNVFI